MSEENREMRQAVLSLLAPWMNRTRPQMSDEKREEFLLFADWVTFHGLRPPVSGLEVAGYLLELIAENVQLDRVRRAAEAIRSYYRVHRVYLDSEPIDAALALAEAQLSPERVLQ